MSTKNKLMFAILKRKLPQIPIGLVVLAAVGAGGSWVYVNSVA